jgi:hypothetical protein
MEAGKCSHTSPAPLQFLSIAEADTPTEVLEGGAMLLTVASIHR